MPPGVASAAACMASPRALTTRRPSAKLSAPANARAVYSPRLRPAAATQWSTAAGWSWRSASRAARLATNRAGWLTTVASRRSFGPFQQTSARS